MAEPVKLEAPNGVKWMQPTGLFINNEFVAAQSGEAITSIDPAYVIFSTPDWFTSNAVTALKSPLPPSKPPASRTLMLPFAPRAPLSRIHRGSCSPPRTAASS